MLIAILLLLSASMVIMNAVALPVVRDIKNVRDFSFSKQSFYTAEAGLEDAVLRLKTNKPLSSPEVLLLGGASATTTSTTVLDQQEIVTIGDREERIRKNKAILKFGAGASFNYGLQADAGGIHLKNSSSILGNVFSNGPITGANSNIVYGDVISADATGLLDNIHATGTAYAHTITGSEIERDAYYQSISGTTVGGTQYPGSPDQATSSLPIPDSLIEDWKNEALDGGIYAATCPYKISENTTIGPLMITCDLEVTGDPIITLNGAVWVEGDITIANTAHVQVNSSLSGKTIPIIADDSSNPTSSGIIQLKNKIVFEGAGSNSYIIFISQNKSAEQGGNITAVSIENSVSGDVLIYAGHGKIEVANSVNLKEITGYRIEVQNSAQIEYESGLASLLFSSGPSGGFVLDDWFETQ